MHGKRLSAAGSILANILAAACTAPPNETERVSLPAISFLAVRPGTEARGEARSGQAIAQSLWAIERSRAVLGSAVAVSGATLIAACNVAGPGGDIQVVRRSTRRTVQLVARDGSVGLCELRPADVRLNAVPGYRSFDSVTIGEPVIAAVSHDSRSFDLVRGSVIGKGSRDDPFLETSLTLPAGTRSAALFDRAGNLMGFGSAGPVGDAVVVAVPIAPEAVPALTQTRPQPVPAAATRSPR